MISNIFRCVSYFAVSHNNNSGILYPVFTKPQGNVPYIQEVDKNGLITSFIEFTDIEEFNCVPSMKVKSFKIGDASAFAYYNGRLLVESDHRSLAADVRTGRLDLNQDSLAPLTKLGLSRIAGSQGSGHIELFERYLTHCGLPLNKAARMIRAEMSLTLSQGAWWEQIFFDEFGMSEEAKSLQGASNEDIIYWLYDHEVSDEWKNICAGLLRRVIFDERVGDILSKFITSNDEFFELDLKGKMIVGRGIELYCENPTNQGEFEDIIYDKIISGELFYIGSHVSPRMISELLRTMINQKKGSGDDQSIIDSMLDYLSGDQIISKVVPSIIDVLFESDLDDLYSENSYYREKTRFDRLIDIYMYNQSLNLAIRDDDLIDVFDEIVEDRLRESD